jgi:hypothetical protein
MARLEEPAACDAATAGQATPDSANLRRTTELLQQHRRLNAPATTQVRAAISQPGKLVVIAGQAPVTTHRHRTRHCCQRPQVAIGRFPSLGKQCRESAATPRKPDAPSSGRRLNASASAVKGWSCIQDRSPHRRSFVCQLFWAPCTAEDHEPPARGISQPGKRPLHAAWRLAHKLASTLPASFQAHPRGGKRRSHCVSQPGKPRPHAASCWLPASTSAH